MTAQPETIATLSGLEPLARLSEGGLRELAALCYRERVERGGDPFRLKSPLEQAVYLIRGELRLVHADGSSEVLVGGSGDTRFALGRRPPPVVSAKAITAVELIRIDDDLLDIMMTWDQLAGPQDQAQAEAPDWRQMSGMYAAQNFTGGVFAALPPAHINTLLGRFERVRVRLGEAVVRQGERGDYYYVIERGRAAVVREVSGARVPVADLNPGDAFGEEALLSDTGRNATVTMKSDGVLLRLAKGDFDALLTEPLLHRIGFEAGQDKARGGAQWIDVRYPAEFQQDRIPGAINLPLDEIRNALGVLDPGREYICYCQSGRRSSAAAFLLSQRGFRAYLLEGGWRPAALTQPDRDAGARKR